MIKFFSKIEFQMRPILCKRRFLEIDDLRRLDETYEYDVFKRLFLKDSSSCFSIEHETI